MIVSNITFILLILSTIVFLTMMRISSNDSLVAANILFNSKYNPWDNKIKLIKCFTLGLYTGFFTTFLTFTIKNFLNENIDLKDLILKGTIGLVCQIFIVIYISSHFEDDLNSIKICCDLKKRKEKLIETNKKIYEIIDEHSEKTITLYKPLNFYGLFLGYAYIYEQNTSKKDEKIFGCVLALSELVTDFKSHFSNSPKLEEIIKANIFNELDKEQKIRYSYLIDALRTNNVNMHHKEITVYESILSFNTETNELCESPFVEIDNAKSQNLLKGLASNEDEDIKRVYEVISNFISNPEYELGKEDIEEIINIYVSDETLKNDFTYILNNNENIYKTEINNLRIFTKKTLI